jgi:hypothetical protein
MNRQPHITNIKLTDGFGSQFQHIISCILISYYSNYQFVYNPISMMEHNYNNDPIFLEKMENLMNIFPYFPKKGDKSIKDHFLTECDMTAKRVIDSNIDAYATEEHLQKIRKMFWENKDRSSIFPKNEKTSVAIHIRRLNILDKTLPNVEPERVNTPDSFYLNAIERIRREHKEKDLEFHIYSQGDIQNFSCYSDKGAILHIDEDLSSSFIEMVASDILVTSFSSLSYIAGFLNDGIVYYQPFWHTKRGCWRTL